MLCVMGQRTDEGMCVVPLIMGLEVEEEGKTSQNEGHFSGP